jgi:hypothetical protein
MKRRNTGFVITLMVLAVSTVLGQIPISLPDTSGQVNTRMNIPVRIGSVTGQNIKGVDITVSFDGTLIDSVEAVTDGTLVGAANMTIQTSQTSNSIRVLGAGATALTGSGVLYYLRVRLKAIGTTSLTFTNIRLEDSDGNAKQTTATNGQLRVRGPNQKPTISTISPKTVTEGDTLRFALSASDPDGDPVSFSSPNLPRWATLSSTGAFQGVPQLGDAGNYSVTFIATDNGGLSDSTVASIEVVKKKLKPTIAAISPITKTEGDTIRIVVSATDPNPGEVLTYSTGPLPAGASFTAATRTFFWVPAFGQAGSYSVLFRVTDTDGLSDSTVASIQVLKALRVVNAIPDTVLTDGNRLYKRKLTAAPVVFDGKGTLTYTASSADPTYVEATIIAPDTLQVRGKINSGGQFITVTVTARDIDNATVSTTFRVRVDGTTEAPSVVALPKEYELAQNYPNPFNPTTVIRFALPKESPVTLEIYNILGVKVRTLIAGETMNAAVHSRVWDGRDDAGLSVPSGIYLYRIEAGSFLNTKKMTLLR